MRGLRVSPNRDIVRRPSGHPCSWTAPGYAPDQPPGRSPARHDAAHRYSVATRAVARCRSSSHRNSRATPAMAPLDGLADAVARAVAVERGCPLDVVVCEMEHARERKHWLGVHFQPWKTAEKVRGPYSETTSPLAEGEEGPPGDPATHCTYSMHPREPKWMCHSPSDL